MSKIPVTTKAPAEQVVKDIQHAETRAEAETALTVFSEKYGVKYEKGVACLTKDREAMLASIKRPPSVCCNYKCRFLPSCYCPKYQLASRDGSMLQIGHIGPRQHGMEQHCCAGCQICRFGVFLYIMTDSVTAGHEDHGRGHH